jgi:predicted DNA-binding transcriptional regulator YafY
LKLFRQPKFDAARLETDRAYLVAVSAIQGRYWLRMIYPRTQEDGSQAPTESVLVPTACYVTRAGDNVLAGWDSLRRCVRHFRMDRILDMQVGNILPEGWELPGEQDNIKYQIM